MASTQHSLKLTFNQKCRLVLYKQPLDLHIKFVKKNLVTGHILWDVTFLATSRFIFCISFYAAYKVLLGAMQYSSQNCIQVLENNLTQNWNWCKFTILFSRCSPRLNSSLYINLKPSSGMHHVSPNQFFFAKSKQQLLLHLADVKMMTIYVNIPRWLLSHDDYSQASSKGKHAQKDFVTYIHADRNLNKCLPTSQKCQAGETALNF